MGGRWGLGFRVWGLGFGVSVLRKHRGSQLLPHMFVGVGCLSVRVFSWPVSPRFLCLNSDSRACNLQPQLQALASPNPNPKPEVVLKSATASSFWVLEVKPLTLNSKLETTSRIC